MGVIGFDPLPHYQNSCYAYFCPLQLCTWGSKPGHDYSSNCGDGLGVCRTNKQHIQEKYADLEALHTETMWCQNLDFCPARRYARVKLTICPDAGWSPEIVLDFWLAASSFRTKTPHYRTHNHNIISFCGHSKASCFKLWSYSIRS